VNTTTSTPSLCRLAVDTPTDGADVAAVVCPHCGGRIDTTTTATEAVVAVVVKAGPQTVDETRAVRVVLAGILRVVFEVIAGRRPVVQLDAVVSGPVGRYVRAAREARGAVVVLRSLRLCFPADEVVEAAAVVRAGGRVHAVAARFENSSGGWRCVAFRIL
jgi:hypothetical protein